MRRVESVCVGGVWHHRAAPDPDGEWLSSGNSSHDWGEEGHSLEWCPGVGRSGFSCMSWTGGQSWKPVIAWWLSFLQGWLMQKEPRRELWFHALQLLAGAEGSRWQRRAGHGGTGQGWGTDCRDWMGPRIQGGMVPPGLVLGSLTPTHGAPVSQRQRIN